MAIIDSLKANPLFAEFEPMTLELLAASFEQLSFKAGQVITREGDQADSFFVVEQGRMKVSKRTDVLEMGPGAHFGEIGILLEAPRTATVTAATDCRILALSVAALDAALVASPYPAAMFLRALAISLAERLRATTDDLAILKTKQPR